MILLIHTNKSSVFNNYIDFKLGFNSRHLHQLALAKKMQAKIPHFGAGFLRLKKKK